MFHLYSELLVNMRFDQALVSGLEVEDGNGIPILMTLEPCNWTNVILKVCKCKRISWSVWKLSLCLCKKNDSVVQGPADVKHLGVKTLWMIVMTNVWRVHNNKTEQNP